MATQCGVNNARMMVQPHHQQFVSSSVYYGYVPLRLEDEASPKNLGPDGMDIDADAQQQRQVQQILESRRNIGQRKRAFGHDEVANYVPRLKRFREEAVVTNVFSMVQETASGQKNMDWPRCTMNRHYYA